MNVEMTIKSALRLNCAYTLALACWLMTGCESAPKTVPTAKPVAKQKENKPSSVPTQAPHAATTEAPRATPALNADVQALKEGVSLYNDGQYNSAIKKLGNSPDIWNGSNKSIQVNALKYMAFSYCVSQRAPQCRQQFERALKIDPSFTLMPSEIGHPLWGPVFLKAKKVK